MRARRLLVLAILAAGCATAPPPPPPPPPAPVALPAPPATVPPLGPPAELRLPAPQRFTLSNGLPVRLVESRRLPIVAVHLVLLDAGAARDPARLPGLASFTAAMVTEGTLTRSAIQISEELGFLGASLSAGASMDAAFVSGYSLSRHLPRLLALLGDVVANPAFPEKDFARVQDQRRVSLLQQRDQPGAIATKTFGKAFWGDHPYGHWAGGTEESVAATTRADLAGFHAARWRPGAAELVVVGDVDAASLRTELEKALGAWKGSEPARVPPEEAPAGRRRAILVEKKGAPQTFLILGMPGIARSDPDYVPAQVLFQILGGGSASRLFRDLREDKGYTYGLSARESASRQGGVSYMGGSVRADATGQAVSDLLAQAQALRDVPVPAAELEDAKDGLVRSLPGDFSSVAGIAGRLAEQAIYALPEDWWERYPARVRAVTPADVQRVARRLLDAGRLVTVMVGDPAVVRPQLAPLPLGEIEERKP